MLKLVHVRFSAMFRRKAYLHGMTAYVDGMDELEFTESESNLLDLISEYESYAEL